MAVIGKIRQNVGLLIGVIAIAMASFLLMDVSSSGLGNSNVNLVGSVEGKDISLQEYELTVQDMIGRYQSAQRELTDETRLKIREDAWDKTVQSVLLEESYDDLGIMITDEEVAQMLVSGGDQLDPTIKNSPMFKDETGKFSQEKLKQYIASFNNPNDPEASRRRDQWRTFEAAIIENRLQSKYTNLISKAVYAPEWLATQKHKEESKKASIDYVVVPYQTVEDSEISVEEADLKAYLKEHASEFKQDKSRTIEVVVFPVEASKNDVDKLRTKMTNAAAELKSTDKEDLVLRRNSSETPFVDKYFKKSELTASYKDSLFSMPVGSVLGPIEEDNSFKVVKIVDRKKVADSIKVRQILKNVTANAPAQQTKDLMDSLKKAIDGGASFADLAKANSDDLTSKDKGGDLGYIQYASSNLPPNIKDSIFFKLKVGERAVIPGTVGFHLIEVVDAPANTPAVKVATLTNFIKATSATRDNIYREASTFAGQNRDLESFRNGAKEKNYKIEKSEDLTKNSYKVGGLGLAQSIVTWAYKNKVGTISERVFQVDQTEPNGRRTSKYVVVALTDIKDAGLPSVDNVRTQLESEVKKIKKAEKIIAKIGSTTDLNQIATANGETVKKSENVTFGGFTVPDMGREPKVQAAVFALNANETSKPILGDRGVYVVKVNSFTEAPAPDAVQAQQTTLLPLRQAADFGLLPSLSKSADVEDNRYKTRQ